MLMVDFLTVLVVSPFISSVYARLRNDYFGGLLKNVVYVCSLFILVLRDFLGSC